MIARRHASDCQQATTGDVCPVHQSLLICCARLCAGKGARAPCSKRKTAAYVLSYYCEIPSIGGLVSFVCTDWDLMQRRIDQCGG